MAGCVVTCLAAELRGETLFLASFQFSLPRKDGPTFVWHIELLDGLSCSGVVSVRRIFIVFSRIGRPDA